LVVLTADQSGYPSCTQAEETVITRDLHWAIMLCGLPSKTA